MTIILRSILAGPHGNGQPGDRLTLDAQAERDLVEGGYAVPVQEVAAVAPPEVAQAAPVPEVAAMSPPETAALPKPKKRG